MNILFLQFGSEIMKAGIGIASSEAVIFSNRFNCFAVNLDAVTLEVGSRAGFKTAALASQCVFSVKPQLDV